MIIVEGGKMSSRMDRYSEKYSNELSRMDKHGKLYDELYEDKNYSNIESASLEVGREIDLDDIKELLNKRSSYNELRDYRIIKPEEPVERKIEVMEEDESNHDINEMIVKAKEERPKEDKIRSLADTQILTLQELVSSKSYANKESLKKEEVEDLINTIYNTNLLSTSEGDGLLDDLKSTGKTVVSPSIKQILDDAKKSMEADMDNSFFTSSLGFKKQDLDNENDEVEESDEKTTRFLLILGALFVTIVIKFVIL